MKLSSLFSGLTRRRYTYVPPCPCCGSRATGRFVKQKMLNKNNKWIMEESLKHGELISLVPDVGRDTAFCFECGYVWPARIQNVWLTTAELAEERNVRGTNQLYEALDMRDEKSSLLKNNPITKY